MRLVTPEEMVNEMRERLIRESIASDVLERKFDVRIKNGQMIIKAKEGKEND